MIITSLEDARLLKNALQGCNDFHLTIEERCAISTFCRAVRVSQEDTLTAKVASEDYRIDPFLILAAKTYNRNKGIN